MTEQKPTHIAEYVVETRYRWEPDGAEPPEGWRRCDMSDFSQDRMAWFVLYTDAPRDKNPHLYNTYWRKHRRITQERYVSEWVDCGTHNDGSEGAQ